MAFKEMDKKYDHKKWEPLIYKKWEGAGVFTPEGAARAREELGLDVKDETFSVLMPPPNANAPLHCGHATYAIQDVMARWKRMQGYKTLYLPGTDHAGFETQVVYERHLKKEGKSRFDFDRQTLYNDILNFVKENSDVAVNQLKSIGMSADWERNTFMLDEHVIDTVYNTFVKMHEDGLVYRDDYMVNYSPAHGTTFSNLETLHVEQKSKLYYVSYAVVGFDGEFITVATTRPETIYADVAIAVNPEDERYKKFVGAEVLNPLNGRHLKVIADAYVDFEFGTGALKITPAHDFNDYEIGKKHNLEMPSVIDLEGRMTSECGDVAGMKVVNARKRTVEILEEKGALEKVDDKYMHNLLVDYKDKKPIEPMLLPNWFVKMENLADSAIDAIEDEKVKFNRETWKYQIIQWLEDIRDWPISRQTVFGIRIPVWYSVKSNPELFVVFIDANGESREGNLQELLSSGDYTIEEVKEGLQKVIASKSAKYVISKKPLGDEYIQETDTFDTWFSSGQWPLTTLKYPDGEDFKEFFPTTFMDSMWDILFFWIARMIMFSLYLVDDVPFKTVYIHGRIDDEHGRKMSKSLGNVIDPLEYVEKYGADALRMGILVGGNTSAKTTSLSEGKVKGYRNFSNKLWNMARFLLMMLSDEGIEDFSDLPGFEAAKEEGFVGSDAEIVKKLEKVSAEFNEHLEKMQFQLGGDALYHFVWHELADVYIEDVKNREAGSKEKLLGLSVFLHVFSQSIKLLHPYMPFVTESIWGHLPRGKAGDLVVSDWVG